MWLIKTKHGYMLEDGDGNFVQWFDMACNSKAYCMEKGVDPIYLTQRSEQWIADMYTARTGKLVWWLR